MSIHIPKSTSVKPSGYVSIFTGDGEHFEGDTMQCVHCSKHWIVQPGSGRRRGFCTKCGGPTCGAHGCDACTPAEKRLEIIEARAKRCL